MCAANESNYVLEFEIQDFLYNFQRLNIINDFIWLCFSVYMHTRTTHFILNLNNVVELINIAVRES